MKYLYKFLLLPALCAFFLLQAQRVAAQSKDNDVLLLEHGFEGVMSGKTYGMYVFWPDKEVEFISMQLSTKPEDQVSNKSLVMKKINELSDLGWELEIVDNTAPTTSYYFKRYTAK
jgi:hypothetical protein